MGIPHYFHVITKNYPGVIHTSKPTTCNHYFLDFNGLIHHSTHDIIQDYKLNNDETNSFDNDIFEKQILENCWKYFNECVIKANPTSMVHICIDGVAPIAKMNQQRKRRFLSIFQYKAKCETPLWDTNAISPGTQFMAKLKAFLSAKIRDTSSKYLYFLSGADDPGEGEHKIMARIASLSNNENIYIYGLDADLIMLSLLSHHPHIYLMREPQHSNSQIHKDNTDDGFIYLDIHALRVALLQELYMTYNWPLDDESRQNPYSTSAKNIIETYIVLCFLLGNDFLPHISCLNLKKHGHDRVLKAGAEAWKTYNSPCVENNRIHTAFLLYVIQLLQNDENSIVLQMNEEYFKKHPFASEEAASDPTYCYPIQEKYKDKLCQMIRELPSNTIQFYWRSLYYKVLFYSKINNSKIIVDASRSYIEGIYWTYAYYKRLPKNSQWYYPYSYPPTLYDISNNIQANIGEWDLLLNQWQENNSPLGFVNSTVQLLCILPYESKHLLPYNVQKLMTDSKCGCIHLYPKSYPIQTYLKTHLWECTPVLPFLDIDLIEQCIKEFV